MNNGERGSALLIVFVLSAMVAIMLYREMPIAAFEAQRQKEQLLIDRAEQYKRAVKLYYIKFGSYPPSIERLEETNRLRFLRHRYRDPLTGKDDWRLLHMGAAGQLMDSKVKPLQTGAPGTNGNTANNQAGSTASTTSSGPVSLGPAIAYMTPGAPQVYHNYPNTSAGDAAAPGGGNTVPALRQRAPAVVANGAANAGRTIDDDAGDDQVEPTKTGEGETQMPALAGGPTGAPPPSSNSNGTPGNSPANSFASPSTNGNQAAGVRSQIGSLFSQPTARLGTGASAGLGQTSAGGLAGVASKAQGHTIKLVEDQQDFSKWEFYYDPRKDVQIVDPTAGEQQGAAGQNANTSAGRGSNNFGLGSSGGGTSNSSGFSITSGFNSGSNTSNPNSTSNQTQRPSGPDQ